MFFAGESGKDAGSMTAKYNVVERGNPADPEAPKKYYPSYVSTGKVRLRDMAERIAEISTMSTIDTMGMLEAFLQVIPEYLAEGKIVDLGEFGSFRLKIKSKGSERAEEVSEENIERVLPQFRAGKEFRKKIREIEFERA